MRLFYSPFHDIIHKSLLVIHEGGLQEDVELIPSFPFRNLEREWVRGQYDTSALNPLGKVPFLALDDGEVLYPSNVVVAYLDSLSPQPLMPEGEARFDCLRRLGLGDAIFDAAVQLSMEGFRPADERRTDLYEWLFPKIAASLTVLNSECKSWSRFDLGHTAILQAISYVDSWATGQRDLPANVCADWREQSRELAAWFDETCQRPSVAAHYKVPYSGDLSPERHAAAIRAVLDTRAIQDD